MKMSSEKSSDKWERIEANQDLVRNTLSLAERDIKTALNVFNDEDYDWSLSIAYNAMLQAGRALMFSEGFRPKGRYQHVAVIEFVRQRFEEFAGQMLFIFNKTRKKRHVAVYEQVKIVSREEAKHVLNWAEKFVKKVREILENKYLTDNL